MNRETYKSAWQGAGIRVLLPLKDIDATSAKASDCDIVLSVSVARCMTNQQHVNNMNYCLLVILCLVALFIVLYNLAISILQAIREIATFRY